MTRLCTAGLQFNCSAGLLTGCSEGLLALTSIFTPGLNP